MAINLWGGAGLQGPLSQSGMGGALHYAVKMALDGTVGL